MGALGTLLVAARGEVAVRIMATAAVLGLPTVAVCPDDDADCAHVARADASVLLPGAGAAAYLDIPALLAAARQAGVGAVHQGYGFLAENPALARACTEAGLVFVGPSAEALELFGDKTRARDRATALGIDVAGGTGVLTDDRAGPAFAASLPRGASVMVKARPWPRSVT
jgi:acetyl/propionyl-CoA carboxylase alpha subunit